MDDRRPLLPSLLPSQVSDIGTIVFGVTSALATKYTKVVFFCLGMLYGANTYFHAAKVRERTPPCKPLPLGGGGRHTCKWMNRTPATGMCAGPATHAEGSFMWCGTRAGVC